MSDEDKIIELLQKLQALKDKGIIDEDYYRRKKEELLNAYLAQPFPKAPQPSRKTKYYIIAISAIIVVIITFLAISHSLIPFSTTVTTTQTIVKTQTVTSANTRTILMTIITANITPQHSSFAPSPKRVTFERTLKSCQIAYYPLQVEKGDQVRVHWESNDGSTYVAIGTDADISQLKSNYCETNIITWHISFPSSDSGYSGTLNFKIPSSAKWYVIIANGNFGCLYSDCPINVSVTIEVM